MNFYVLTLFPGMITDAARHSILKRAEDSGKIGINCVNIRDFAANKHKQVDDTPYGGGAGMVLSPQPVYDAFCHVRQKIKNPSRVCYLTPQGKPFTQELALKLAKEQNLILICGHYEGIDQRVIDKIAPDEISIGDYILTGGELGALVVIDAVARLVPGVLGNAESAQSESFSDGLLEHPHYTKPPVFMGEAVPDVLLSGHHQNIRKWRQDQAIERTKLKRPDLLKKCSEKNQTVL